MRTNLSEIIYFDIDKSTKKYRSITLCEKRSIGSNTYYVGSNKCRLCPNFKGIKIQSNTRYIECINN